MENPILLDATDDLGLSHLRGVGIYTDRIGPGFPYKTKYFCLCENGSLTISDII